MTEYNEGDVNSNERGTCARANKGKIRFSLFPMHLLYGACRVFMWGAQKYAEWNWAKGGKWSTAFDCLNRHLMSWWYFREEFDKESGEHHLDHAMCNLTFLIHFKDTYKDGDDRPDQELTAFNLSLDSFRKQVEFNKNSHNIRYYFHKNLNSVWKFFGESKAIRISYNGAYSTSVKEDNKCLTKLNNEDALNILKTMNQEVFYE